jgi:hypothetical protein
MAGEIDPVKGQIQEIINEPLIKLVDKYIGFVYTYNAKSLLFSDDSYDSVLLVISSGSNK